MTADKQELRTVRAPLAPGATSADTWLARSMISLGGGVRVWGTAVGYFATVDPGTQSVWLTLNGTVSSSVTLRVC